jgi:hypothetical protein
VGKYKLILSYLNSHASFVELVGHIFCILNEFPNPSNLGTFNFREIVEVLGELLRQLLEAGLVF